MGKRRWDVSNDMVTDGVSWRIIYKLEGTCSNKNFKLSDVRKRTSEGKRGDFNVQKTKRGK